MPRARCRTRRRLDSHAAFTPALILNIIRLRPIPTLSDMTAMANESTTFPSGAPQALGLSADRLARIGTALEAEVSAGTLPGAVVAIAREGRLAYHEAFGYLDPSTRVPMTKHAIFSIASMTKPIVVVAALMLYEEGRLMVNEPVAKYLPQLGRMRVGVPGCDGSAAMTV